MPTSNSLLTRSWDRLFGTHSQARRSNSRTSAKAARHRRFETLEDRNVFSATLGSALTIGNGDEGSAIFDIAADTAGNSYVAGLFRGTVDFDLSNVRAEGSDVVTSRGDADGFIAKYAPDDSLIWVRRMGSDAGVSEFARRLAVDSAGDVYVAGEFAESADFGSSTLTSVGSSDGFVAKIDADGNFIWASRWGTVKSPTSRGVDVDASGNVYVYSARLTSDDDIMKFSPEGRLLWTRNFATRSLMSFGDLAVTANGEVFVAGSFQGVVDFDPSVKTKNISGGAGHAAFVLNLDTNGKLDWVSPFLGKSGLNTNSSYGMSVEIDRSGAIVIGGGFRGTVDFNPGSGTSYLTQQDGGFIAKLSSTGSFVWAKQLQSDANVFVYGLDSDAAGNIYATGVFYGTADFDPGAGVQSRTSNGATDIYILKLSSAGNFVWTETFGGTGNDVAFEIVASPNGDTSIAGYYLTPFDVDPNPLSTQLLPSGLANRGLRLRLRQL